MIEFDSKPFKIQSREDMVRFIRGHSKKSALPDGRQFWSLCNKQSKKDTSEINQLVNLGFIKKEQYVGVDWKDNIISANRRRHPSALWINGSWEYVIKQQHKIFNPGVVFLDFTSLAVTQLVLTATKRTLQRCPENTYLFANVMLNNPHDSRKYAVTDFMKQLFEEVTDVDFEGWKWFTYAECKEWDIPLLATPPKNPKGMIYYPYSCTNKTAMAMYPFWKGLNK